MNLVVGATGFVGMEICRLLRGANRPVRALVRPGADRTKTNALNDLGVELVIGDLKDPRQVAAACQDANAIISTASATVSRGEGDTIDTVDRKGQLDLVDAAVAEKVSHFIYVSFSGNIDDDFPLRNAKREVENRLIHSNMHYTILRPSFFMEVWLSPHLGFDYGNAKVQIYGNGQSKISWISLVNVAQFAAAAIDNPEARNKVIDLGGPEALSPLEAVRIFESASSRDFEITHVSEEALAAQNAAATDSLQKTISALMLAYAKGDIIPMEGTLKKFPLQLTSVSDYAKRVLTK